MYAYNTTYPSYKKEEKNNKESDPYSFLGAQYYDYEASYMSIRYKEAHEIQNSIIHRLIKNNNAINPVIIDFGCGTGSDGLEILSKNIDAIFIGIDSSEYMLQVALKKYKENKICDRSLLLNHDFQRISPDYLISKIKSANLKTEVSFVISSLVLHHYSTEKRMEFYRLVAQLLGEGGYFLLTDLFSNSIDICDHIALEQEVNDVTDSITKLRKQGILQCNESTLSVRHYRNINQPFDLLNEVQLLLQCDFDAIDVVFRAGQLAVVIIKKEKV